MNKYEILSIIGEGTYGVVLKARCKPTGEFVAIKKFKEKETNDDNLRKTTVRELKMLSVLKQENIITLRDAFRRRGRLHLVFEYFEKNLLECLQMRSSGLPPEIVRIYMYQLVRAINYCHQQGVVHRDIKPENLLINPDHRLKLCDFGFARHAPRGDFEHDRDAMTDYVATRWYRSPELLVGCEYSFPVDIWSMGCIMGELIDGSPLFPGETEIDQLYIIQKVQGPLTPEQSDMFYKNPNFKGYKFPDMSNPRDNLERKYGSVLNKEGFSLLRGLLEMDPKARLTASQCLEHAYFEGIDVDSFCKEHEDLSRYLDHALFDKRGNKAHVKHLPNLSGRISSRSKDPTPRTERRVNRTTTQDQQVDYVRAYEKKQKIAKDSRGKSSSRLSPRSPTPVYSARKKKLHTNQMHAFSPVPQTLLTQISNNPQSRTEAVPSQAKVTTDGSKSQRRSASMSRAGSVIGMHPNSHQKPLPKISQVETIVTNIPLSTTPTPGLIQMQVHTQVVTPQQHSKPISRRNGRSNSNGSATAKQQNFMTPLVYDRQPLQPPNYQFSHLEHAPRPNTSTGMYLDQPGFYHQQPTLKVFQAVGAHDGRSGYW